MSWNICGDCDRPIDEEPHCRCNDCYDNGFHCHEDCLADFDLESVECCEGCKEREAKRLARQAAKAAEITNGIIDTLVAASGVRS
jgi:hypothetical protein